MTQGPVLENVLKRVKAGKASHWVLLDPDDFSPKEGARIAASAESAGVNAVLVGGSLMRSNNFDDFVHGVKESVSLPVILFPGDATQLSRHADAVLFLSLVSGRNPVNLIGEQVKGAPVIKEFGIEPISTAYMLVESGAVSSVEFMSNTRPLPRKKPMIAAAHALAAQYMGMQMVYLEAGSGAPCSVPPNMVKAVGDYVDIPVIVGGGIRDAATAREKLQAGANVIVTGNLLLAPDGVSKLEEIARAVTGETSR
ncbi:MAG: geranylgeranylglyceryl/heptaprenylglyceryl phosphate synthase [Chitinivibrionales bacterium]|nr:geranylgeranylglyceryl/heptaprenylglyceryl phosphate synthase [Chitinivibrionales bacterium]MBD3358445.1 geranylgeranylglyceryl/heptaprenylglyceryl phosphate synthase [Chitinivibrionales bacterium]